MSAIPPILSILIPTTPERVEMFSRLHMELFRQITYVHTVHPTLGRVEIIADDSKRFLDGGLSIGAKRESLLRRATGDYLCYLDSDESISPNYVETLVRLCGQNKDLCTFRAVVKTDHYWTVVDMSFYNPENEDATPDRIVKRTAWHVCPVRSRIAKRFHFPDTNYGEDYEWMREVLKACHSEAKTDAIIFQYNHSKQHSEADKITNHV